MHYDSRTDERPPDKRLNEIATILAHGLLRLKKRPILATRADSPNSPKTTGTALDVPGDSRLSVTSG